MLDDMNDPSEETPDDIFATWGCVDANGEHSIRGVKMDFPNDSSADLQGDFIAPEAMDAALARWRLQNSMNRYTKEFFMNGAIPPGMLSRSYTYRKPKNVSARFAILLLILWWASVVGLLYVAYNLGKAHR